MRNSTKIAVALALIADTIMIAAAGINYNAPADPTVLPFAGTHSKQTAVRTTKSDRLDARPDVRRIAGVSVVLRDFSRVVR